MAQTKETPVDETAVTAMPEDAPTESGQIDYFGFDERNIVTLPDGKSWVEHKTLTEGERRKYQNALGRDVRIDRAKGDMHMKLNSGDEKKELLMAAITDWSLVRKDKSGQVQPLPCTLATKREFLDQAPPKIVDLIEKDVRKVNAWLQSEMSVEDLQREIDQLEELKQQKIEDEEGK